MGKLKKYSHIRNLFSEIYWSKYVIFGFFFDFIIMLGLSTERGEVKSNIILSGDPNQLDAVTLSKYAKQFGYSRSYMERLCDEPCYQRQRGKYNTKCIVQLTKNFRSHSFILDIANRLFYDGSLECKAAKGLLILYYYY